jgi:conjugal transfer mating pair stabilization protein TraN
MNLDRDTCQLPSTGQCPTGYRYAPPPVGLCEKPITCSKGPYDPITNTCPKVWSCPLGTQFVCGVVTTGPPKCSALACANTTSALPDETTDPSNYVNDGTTNAAGGCSGTWLIFNGMALECLPPGLKTSFFNCCDSDPANFLFIRKSCSEEAYEVAVANDADRTHYIGSYCKKKIEFIGCVQRAKVYCVFNSKMGRIIQEGCRPQLIDFGPTGSWGSAKSPNCVGLTPEQFQSCDFGKIDFSEMLGDFAPNLNNVAPNVQGAVNDYMQNLR